MMTASEMAERIAEAICSYDESVQGTVRSYEDAGVMTSNAGFVIRDGNQEFQVTVVRSK